MTEHEIDIYVAALEEPKRSTLQALRDAIVGRSLEFTSSGDVSRQTGMYGENS